MRWEKPLDCDGWERGQDWGWGSQTFKQSWELIRKLRRIHGQARLHLLDHHLAELAVGNQNHGLRCCIAHQELSHPFWFQSLLPCTSITVVSASPLKPALCKEPAVLFLLVAILPIALGSGLRSTHSISPPEPVSIICPPGVTTYRLLPLMKGESPSITPELGSS